MIDKVYKAYYYKVEGLTCASCEIVLEQAVSAIPGITKTHVNHKKGILTVFCEQEPNREELSHRVKECGYTVIFSDINVNLSKHENGALKLVRVGGIFLIIISLYIILKQFDILPESLGFTGNMSYWLIFLIGLTAASSSCIAVTGGLLLALSAKYPAVNTNSSFFKRFKPHLYFNIGRISSYTVFGALIGGLGSLFAISPKINGIIILFASIVMILAGINLLDIVPKTKLPSIRIFKQIGQRVYSYIMNHEKSAPFTAGALTFFLPCGFTQALQLYVLSKASILTGSFSMFFFSLGTLPALLSLSVFSSADLGKWKTYFLKFSGALIVIIGILNINSGLALTGSKISFNTSFIAKDSASAKVKDEEPKNFKNGKQIVYMKIVGLDYLPHRFEVYKDIPVEWRIDGSLAAGCGQIITVPSLNLNIYIPKDKIKTVEFTPRKLGDIPFNCSMGMMTQNAGFKVVENTTGYIADSIEDDTNSINDELDGCDPNFANCLPVQKLEMTISEQGMIPNYFKVKKDIPVELQIDAQVPLRGCMSTLVIPDYDIVHPILDKGKSTMRFMPTESGNLPIICGMGSKMIEIEVE